MRKFLTESKPPDPVTIETRLWNEDVTESNSAIVLEQYKLYVEMADRVSSRRSLANTFFLTLNTAVFAAIGVLWENPPEASPWLGLFPLIALVLQCAAWYWIIRSYRQLNSAKWCVVGALERRLPASPWWSAEWTALGEGRDPSRYWPLTHAEQWVPVLFMVAYAGGFIALTLT